MEYEQPIPLAGDILKQRIFSPLSYPLVRRVNVVAIASSEAARYAAHYPIAWRRNDGAYELVVVRSLLDDGTGHPPGLAGSLPFLPIIARAYPLLFGPRPAPDMPAPKYIDVATADTGSDVGAPIAHSDGRPSKALLQRIALLDAAAPLFAQTALLGRELEKADLFEPWQLRFDNVEGYILEIAGLYIVRQSAALTGAFSPLLKAHGVALADLLGLHRLSLFRTGALLAQARMALRQSRLDEQAAAAAAANAPAAAGAGA